MADWAPPESDFAPPAAAPDWTPPESDFAPAAPPETAGRLAGVAARGLAGGVADLPNKGVQLAQAAENPLLSGIKAAGPLAHALRQKLGLDPANPEAPAAPEQPPQPTPAPQLADFVHPSKWKEAAHYFAEKMGAPVPATPAERVVSSAAENAPIGAIAPGAPIAGALSAAAGGAGAQTAAEMGGGPIAQTLTGLAAGSVPALGAGIAAGTRGVVRGGAPGQAEMQARMADAAATGTDLSVGQASGNRAVQYLEGSVAKLPGGAPVKSLVGEQAESLGSHTGRIIENLSQGADVSPTAAGTAINVGAETAKKTMHAAESAAFAKRDALVPHGTPTSISNTLNVLDGLATPTPGAEATTGALLSPKITQLRDNLTADAVAAGSTRANAAIPYQAVRQLRTAVGNQIDWGFAPADPVTNGAMKKVWGALSDDLTAGASAVSPQAEQAAKEANTLYAANQSKRDFLNGIVEKNGGPEAVYQAATNGTKQGATKISGVMSAIDPDQQNIVRATVLDKLGRASGAQDAPFSPSTFLTGWTKLDPSAKDALFGASGTPGSLRSGLDSLTNTIKTIRSGTKLQNWSGSGEAIGHSAGLVAAFEGLKSLAAGEPHVLMGTVAGVAANNILARALTNPRVVNWLAQSTKAPLSALPNAVNQLSKLNDPDAQALAQYLQQSPSAPIARASGGKVDMEALVTRLMNRWRAAKKATDATTKPLLKAPDAVIARALDVAQRHL